MCYYANNGYSILFICNFQSTFMYLLRQISSFQNFSRQNMFVTLKFLNIFFFTEQNAVFIAILFDFDYVIAVLEPVLKVHKVCNICDKYIHIRI